MQANQQQMTMSDAMAELRKQAEEMSQKAQKDADQAAQELQTANSKLESAHNALQEAENSNQSAQVTIIIWRHGTPLPFNLAHAFLKCYALS